jgi:predicted phosphoribosyltransferase
MGYPPDSLVIECSELRNRPRIFADRVHGGRVLARMLEGYSGSGALVMAVPAGGVPVGAELATRLGLPLDVAVVSKITLPWNTEAGYGAVAFDGTVRINRSLAASVGLSEAQIRQGIENTTARVSRRMQRLRGDKPWPDLRGRPVIVVDDGLASGFTMLVTLQALRGKGADQLVVAVPTAPHDTFARLAERGYAVYCANVREGRPFAVADAYKKWADVREEDAATILARWATG